MEPKMRNTTSKFQSRASSVVTAAQISNGWKMGTGADVGGYSDRLLFKLKGQKAAVLYLHDMEDTLIAEVMDNDSAEADQEDLRVNSVNLAAAEKMFAKHGFGKSMPSWEFIGWLFTGAAPTIKR